MMGQRERDALDRYITGNYGEDQFKDYGPEVRLCGKEHDGICAAEVAEEFRYEEELAIHEGRATELMHCYMCEPDVTKRFEKNAGPLRGVGKSKTLEAHRDPTTALQMIPCGHWLI
jgi:hypothetical protein